MAIHEVPQIGLLDQVMENEALKEALEKRQQAKDKLDPIRKDFRAKDEIVNGEITALDLPDGEYRCGRFIIKIGQSEAREVSFERQSKRTVRIGTAKD